MFLERRQCPWRTIELLKFFSFKWTKIIVFLQSKQLNPMIRWVIQRNALHDMQRCFIYTTYTHIHRLISRKPRYNDQKKMLTNCLSVVFHLHFIFIQLVITSPSYRRYSRQVYNVKTAVGSLKTKQDNYNNIDIAQRALA